MSAAVRDPARRQGQAGLTLVEMMVAMAVGLILMAGVIQIFASNKQTYRIQDATSRLQENGRFAVDMLRRDIRMAGFWGCSRTLVSLSVNVDTSGAGYSDVDPTQGGINGTDGAAGAPDTIILQGAFGGGVTVNSHALPAASLNVPAGNGLEKGQIVLISDCTNGDISQITDPANPSTAGNVVVNTGNAVAPGNVQKPMHQYGDNAQIYSVHKLTYHIANGASGQPSLFLNEDGTDQEVVEGVEDMQILYGEDTDADGTANRYVPAGTAGLIMDNVVSVRVALTLRTLEDNVALNAANGDRRIRNTFTTTVVLRNRTS